MPRQPAWRLTSQKGTTHTELPYPHTFCVVYLVSSLTFGFAGMMLGRLSKGKKDVTKPCTAANGGGPLRSQSPRLAAATAFTGRRQNAQSVSKLVNG